MTKIETETESKALLYIEGRLELESIPSQGDDIHPLSEALVNFMQRMDDIYFAARTMIPASMEIHNRTAKRLDKRLADAEKKIKTGSPAEASFAGAAIIAVGHESERLYRSRLPDVLERSLFVSLFSEYDYFFGVVLRELYRRRPDLLASLTKQISFDELLKFENIEAVKDSVLESEIDSIRRESYVEQFAVLQKKFGLPLTKFPEWPIFIEAAQRRNLMVHCGGYVSEQYLIVSENSGYRFDPRPKSATSSKSVRSILRKFRI